MKQSERNQDIQNIFEAAKAIITNGHFVYASGLHGDTYINKDAIYPHTAYVSKLCSYIAEEFIGKEVYAVIGPVVGGVALSQWTAHHLSLLMHKEVFALYADKEEKSGETNFVIKRGQDKFITNGKRILVVEDILTTGGSVKKVIEAVRMHNGTVVGVGALCNRGQVTAEDIGEVPVLRALKNVTLQTYDMEKCPLCLRNVPINTTVGKGKEYLEKKGKKIE